MAAVVAVEGAELAVPLLEEGAIAAEGLGSKAVQVAAKEGKKVEGIASSIVQRAEGALGMAKKAETAAPESRVMQRLGDVALGVGVGQAFGKEEPMPEPPKTGGGFGRGSGFVLAIMIILIIVIIYGAVLLWRRGQYTMTKRGRYIAAGIPLTVAVIAGVWGYYDYNRGKLRFFRGGLLS